MSPNSPQQDFLLDVIRDIVARMDELRDKLDEKVDKLDEKMDDMEKNLYQLLSSRFDSTDKKLDEHESKIQKHEHNFSIATFFLTSGIATAVSWYTWLSGLFNHRTP